jgi:hypothetical protein
MTQKVADYSAVFILDYVWKSFGNQPSQRTTFTPDFKPHLFDGSTLYL